MKDQYKIIKCNACENYDLAITFADGKSGIVNLKHLVGSGVFKKWENYDEFVKVQIDPIAKTIFWGEDIDLDPVTLRKTIEKPRAQ